MLLKVSYLPAMAIKSLYELTEIEVRSSYLALPNDSLKTSLYT